MFPLIHSVKSIFLIIIFGVSSFIYADNEAMALLNRMNQALHQLTYTGTLAYLRGDSLSTLHIEHTVNNGVEAERVVRMNEEGSEVSRELNGFSLASIPRIRPEMLKVYSFDMGRQNRIANIPCTIITARPKDRARYLQKYCIDTTSGMLLDYMLVGKSHKPVEQFMFTTIEIQLPESLAKVDVDVGELKILGAFAEPVSTDVVNRTINTDTRQKRTIVDPRVHNSFQKISDKSLDDGWVMEALPVGYEISQAPHMETKLPDVNGITKHYIVSDGLSSLSVFVSPLTENSPPSAVKINSGALNVVTQQKAGHMITVVGEVPEITLKNIADSMNKK